MTNNDQEQMFEMLEEALECVNDFYDDQTPSRIYPELRRWVGQINVLHRQLIEMKNIVSTEEVSVQDNKEKLYLIKSSESLFNKWKSIPNLRLSVYKHVVQNDTVLPQSELSEWHKDANRVLIEESDNISSSVKNEVKDLINETVAYIKSLNEDKSSSEVERIHKEFLDDMGKAFGG